MIIDYSLINHLSSHAQTSCRRFGLLYIQSVCSFRMHQTLVHLCSPKCSLLLNRVNDIQISRKSASGSYAFFALSISVEFV